MPHNLEGNKVAEYTDIRGKHFVVIERNGITFIQQTTMGKTHDSITNVDDRSSYQEVYGGKVR